MHQAETTLNPGAVTENEKPIITGGMPPTTQLNIFKYYGLVFLKQWKL